MEKCRINRGDEALADSKMLFQCYLSWIGEFMSNLGIGTDSEVEGRKGHLTFDSCPWASEGTVSPIFCLICRVIVIRSFTWTNLKGNVEQTHCMEDDGEFCNFEFVFSPHD